MSVYSGKNAMAAFLNEQPANPTLDTVRFVFHFCNLVNLTLGAIAFGAGILFSLSPINAPSDSSIKTVETKFLVTGIFVVIHGIIGAYGCVSKQSRCLMLYGMLGVCLLVVGAFAAWTAFLGTTGIPVQARRNFYRYYIDFNNKIDIEKSLEQKSEDGTIRAAETPITKDTNATPSGDSKFVWQKIYYDKDCQMDGWISVDDKEPRNISGIFKDNNTDFEIITKTSSFEKMIITFCNEEDPVPSKNITLNLEWRYQPSQSSSKMVPRDPDRTRVKGTYKNTCDSTTTEGVIPNQTLNYHPADRWRFTRDSEHGHLEVAVRDLSLINLSMKECVFNKAIVTRVGNQTVYFYKRSKMIIGELTDADNETLLDDYSNEDVPANETSMLPERSCLYLIRKLARDRIITMYVILFLLSVTQSVCLVCNILFVIWSLKEEADETELLHKEQSLKIKIVTRFLPCCFKVPGDSSHFRNDLSEIVDDESMPHLEDAGNTHPTSHGSIAMSLKSHLKGKERRDTLDV